jgi:hypothetical protein
MTVFPVTAIEKKRHRNLEVDDTDKNLKVAPSISYNVLHFKAKIVKTNTIIVRRDWVCVFVKYTTC